MALCGGGRGGDEGPLKCVVVGDGSIGKTCQLKRILHSRGDLDHFDIDEEYEATTFDTQVLDGVEYEGKKYTVELWDTAGQEAMESLRRLSYPDADVFLLGFAVNSSTSLQNIIDKWIPDIASESPGANIVLAGFKCDLRDESSIDQSSFPTLEDCQITAAEIAETNAEVSCRAYIETSAKTDTNCNLCLQLITAVAVEHRNKKVDKKFPVFKQDENTGDFPDAMNLLKPKVKKAPPAPTAASSTEGGSKDVPSDSSDHKRKATPQQGDDEPGCACTVQ